MASWSGVMRHQNKAKHGLKAATRAGLWSGVVRIGAPPDVGVGICRRRPVGRGRIIIGPAIGPAVAPSVSGGIAVSRVAVRRVAVTRRVVGIIRLCSCRCNHRGCEPHPQERRFDHRVFPCCDASDIKLATVPGKSARLDHFERRHLSPVTKNPTSASCTPAVESRRFLWAGRMAAARRQEPLVGPTEPRSPADSGHSPHAIA